MHKHFFKNLQYGKSFQRRTSLKQTKQEVKLYLKTGGCSGKINVRVLIHLIIQEAFSTPRQGQGVQSLLLHPCF